MSQTAVDRWGAEATVRPVAPDFEGCVLHSYFTANPESPDGSQVLAYLSTLNDAQRGDVCAIDRTTGARNVLVGDVEVEDAHRQANQQWTCGGEYVVYMALEAGTWRTMRVNRSGTECVSLCDGRQVGWGGPDLDEVPLCGPHWIAGAHRDLEMLDVRTGEIRRVVEAEAVVSRYAEYVGDGFASGASRLSVFFPVLSPDGTRVFFKMAAPGDGNMRSAGASERRGLFVYDVARGRALGMRPEWGHPSWCPDSRHILDKREIVDTDTMAVRTIPWYPARPNSHASVSPDGSMLAVDVAREGFTAKDGHWAVLVGDFEDAYVRLSTAEGRGDGTASWRKVHPHPVFNGTGDRVYFNVNEGARTHLHVAELR